MPATLPRHDDARRWLEELRGRGVPTVAAAFELEAGPARSLRPCPACGWADARGSGDRRGPVGMTPDGMGWTCHRCQAKGDAVTLAAWHVAGSADPSGRWADVRRACAARGLCDPDPRDDAPPPHVRKAPPAPIPLAPMRRPPAGEVAALWGACVPMIQAPEVVQYLANVRGWSAEEIATIQRLDLARALPPAPPAVRWFPAGWVRTWRLVMPAFEPNGTMASLHARAIDADVKPKSRWPYGCDAGGLFLANAAGLALLRGEALEGIERVRILEGLTDTLRAAVRDHLRNKPVAVLGVASGGARALGKIRWPAGLPCYVATDNDATGDAYANDVRTALPPAVQVRRVRLEKGKR